MRSNPGTHDESGGRLVSLALSTSLLCPLPSSHRFKSEQGTSHTSPGTRPTIPKALQSRKSQITNKQTTGEEEEQKA